MHITSGMGHYLKNMAKLSSKESALLSKFYYSVDHGFSYSNNPQALYKYARKFLPKLTMKKIKYWFTQQPVPSIFSQQRNIFPRVQTMVGMPHLAWSADLGDLGSISKFNDKKRYLLLVNDSKQPHCT